MSTEPVFDVVDGRFVATELASGPWDRNAQIGGAPAALLARAFELVPAAEGLLLGRLTYDFIRPAPVGPVEVRAEIVRPGKRVQLLEASMLADGVEVVRARGLRVRRAEADGAGAADSEPMRWREIEVEVLSPGAEATAVLEAVGKVLREAGARPSASRSKLARVLGTG